MAKPHPPILVVAELESLQLIAGQMDWKLETNLLTLRGAWGASNHHLLSIGHEGEGLTRPHSRGDGHLEHLVVGGWVHR